MACYCADWCSGKAVCIGPVGPPFFPLQACLDECHRRGMGVVDFNGATPCGDGEGGTCRFLVKVSFPGDPVVYTQIDLGMCSGSAGLESRCSDQGQWAFFEAVFPGYTAGLPPGYEQYFEIVELVSVTVQYDCTPNPKLLPCCHPFYPCAVTDPELCSSSGGRWSEFGQFTQSNPCDNPSAQHPCNLFPCCRPGRCDLTTNPRCAELNGTPGAIDKGGNSCWRFAEFVDENPQHATFGCHIPRPCLDPVPDCVGGRPRDDYAVTIRPDYHIPPDARGDAELVSVNPNRSGGGSSSGDCKWNYARVGLVSGAPGGDAFMMVNCSEPRLFDRKEHHGPAVIRNGDVRFASAYRAA